MNSISFARGCQRGVIFMSLALAWASPAWAQKPAAPRPKAAAPTPKGLPLGNWRLDGSMSLNWRNVGPRRPGGFETQIQNQVFLADMYFGFHGPVFNDVPFFMEFHMPTGGQGRPELYRFFFEYARLERWRFQGGKFLVPFGRYNELYRPDMFLTVTRPLLYASPDSLDLVVRINSPRPPFSSAYADIGARVTYYPPKRLLVPTEATVFVVNGLGESANRQRTFPTPENLGITPPPANGVSLDFGHQNNNLADNNNNKAFGGRLVWGLGDMNLPWPVPEAQRELNGVSVGLSGMGGQYNLEADLNYHMLGVDLGFEWRSVHVSAEYMYSLTQFRPPLIECSTCTTVRQPSNFVRDFEINQGYYVQVDFPLWRRPPVGRKLTGVLVYNRMFRRGPQQTLLLNQTVDGEFFESIAAFDPAGFRADRTLVKWTAAVHWQLSRHFSAKFDYSYWDLEKASTQDGLRDIYQGAFSIVVGF